jgi:hypothetical protein
MLRRYGWLVFFLVAFCVLAFSVVSRWQQERLDSQAADALLDDLRRETTRLRERPGELRADDLQSMLDFQKDLVERTQHVLPRAPAESRRLLNEALKEYLEVVRSVHGDRKAPPPDKDE